MREWVNFKVQQFNDDTYLNDEVSTIGNQTLKYEITPLHSFLYKGESAKNLEKHICALLKREYTKNLALMIEGNKFIYCNKMADVFAFAKDFVKAYSDVYELADKPNTKNVGNSIKELIKCYDNADKKEFEAIEDFLLRLPNNICIKSKYLDQYAPYYTNALKFLLSILATIFNTDIKQPKPKVFSGFREEIINTDKKRFNEWFDRFESEYSFETPTIQKDFVYAAHVSVTAESFNNLKVHFKDIDFYAESSFQTITDLFLNFPFVRTLEFENCNFNFWFYENSKSLFFKNCTFNDVFNYNAMPNKIYQSVASVVMFENCIFNSDITLDDMKEGMSNALILKDCRFAKNANFRLSNISFLKSVFENNIFEGKVFFEKVNFTAVNWKNMFFLADFKSNDIVLPAKAKISQMLFGAKMVKMANKSIYSFIKVLKAYKINDCASELETLYLNNMDTTKSKTELEIAMKTKWFNMKQTATVLGISYATLLAMRKEDKASGIIRIPYVGEGKSTRYYAPLVQAYKDRDFKRVNELAKEMEEKHKK